MRAKIEVDEVKVGKFGNTVLIATDGKQYSSTKGITYPDIKPGEIELDVWDYKNYWYFKMPGKKEAPSKKMESGTQMTKEDWGKKDDQMARMNANTNATNMAIAFKDLLLASNDGKSELIGDWRSICQVRDEMAKKMFDEIKGA